MTDIVFIGLFLSLALVNFSRNKKIKTRVYLGKLEKTVGFLVFIIFFLISYKTRNDFMSHSISFSMALFFFTGIYFKGLGEDAIYSTVNRGLIVKEVPRESIRKMRIEERKKYLLLSVESRSGMSYEKFAFEDRPELEAFIEKQAA